MNETKEVNFRIYCPKCKHYPLPQEVEPCNECLMHGYNIDSHKPVNFKEKDYGSK